MTANRLTPCNTRLAISGIYALMLLGCLIGGFRYLDPLDWWTPTVDWRALQARAQREQPVGGDVNETVAFLRRLGFEDRNIRIQRLPADHWFPGRLATIQAWIPQ